MGMDWEIFHPNIGTLFEWSYVLLLGFFTDNLKGTIKISCWKYLSQKQFLFLARLPILPKIIIIEVILPVLTMESSGQIMYVKMHPSSRRGDYYDDLDLR